MAALSTRRFALDLATPIVLASGPAGFGFELDGSLVAAVGALTTKTVTPEPRAGNPQPRLVDCPSGLLNSIGLENPGFAAFVEEYLPRVLDLPTRRIISLAADRPDEIGRMVGLLEEISEIDGVELNLSCPNVDAVIIGTNPALVGEFVRQSRALTTHPMFVKLPGDSTTMIPAAAAALNAGADGLTLINSVSGLRIDHRIGLPMLHRTTGGLCGPAILPIALARVYEARRAFPDALIIGTGGVTDVEGAIEMLAAGADAVGIGYGVMADPSLPARLTAELETWLTEHRYASPADIIGAAHRGGFDVP